MSNQEPKETKLKCPLCGGKIIETDKVFRCENSHYNFETKEVEGCKFSIFKNQKLFDKNLTENDLEKLLNKECLKNENKELCLDLDNDYFTKVIFLNKKEPKETKLKCPLCGGKIIETDKVFKCENSHYNFETKEVEGCKFSIFKNQKLFDKNLTENDLEKLLNKECLKNNDKELCLDLNNDYFTKVIFLKK